MILIFRTCSTNFLVTSRGLKQTQEERKTFHLKYYKLIGITIKMTETADNLKPPTTTSSLASIVDPYSIQPAKNSLPFSMTVRLHALRIPGLLNVESRARNSVIIFPLLKNAPVFPPYAVSIYQAGASASISGQSRQSMTAEDHCVSGQRCPIGGVGGSINATGRPDA